MKRILVTVGLLAVVVAVALVGYVAWFLRHAVSDRTEVRASVRPLEGSVITVEVVVRSTENPVMIREISLERALQEALGLDPPEGFKVEALPLEDGENDDPDAVEHVAKYNREKVRYVGSRTVKPGSSELLRFAAARPRAASGEIQLQYERRVGVGGSIGFTSVKLAVPEALGQ